MATSKSRIRTNTKNIYNIETWESLYLNRQFHTLWFSCYKKKYMKKLRQTLWWSVVRITIKIAWNFSLISTYLNTWHLIPNNAYTIYLCTNSYRYEVKRVEHEYLFLLSIQQFVKPGESIKAWRKIESKLQLAISGKLWLVPVPQHRGLCEEVWKYYWGWGILIIHIYLQAHF